jgi:hypothetical protein
LSRNLSDRRSKRHARVLRRIVTCGGSSRSRSRIFTFQPRVAHGSGRFNVKGTGLRTSRGHTRPLCPITETMSSGTFRDTWQSLRDGAGARIYPWTYIGPFTPHAEPLQTGRLQMHGGEFPVGPQKHFAPLGGEVLTAALAGGVPRGAVPAARCSTWLLRCASPLPPFRALRFRAPRQLAQREKLPDPTPKESAEPLEARQPDQEIAGSRVCSRPAAARVLGSQGPPARNASNPWASFRGLSRNTPFPTFNDTGDDAGVARRPGREDLRVHGPQYREGQAGPRHGPGALCPVQHERPPHPRRVAGGHGARRP